MPACFEMSDVGAAVRPRSANRRVAASRIAFRLSSLLGRATDLLYYRVHTQLYIGSMLMASEGGGRNRMKGGQLANPKLPSLAAAKQFASAGFPSAASLPGVPCVRFFCAKPWRRRSTMQHLADCIRISSYLCGRTIFR